jgi:hypothetical protein
VVVNPRKYFVDVDIQDASRIIDDIAAIPALTRFSSSDELGLLSGCILSRHPLCQQYHLVVGRVVVGATVRPC